MKYNILSLKIKKIRQTVGLNQEQLSEKLGVSLATIKTYEIGTRFPSRKIKEKLCDLGHMTLEDLEGSVEKNELKDYIISIINNHDLQLEELNGIKITTSMFWEKCFEMYSNNNFSISSTVDFFKIEHKKTSAKYVKVNKSVIKDISNTKEVSYVCEVISNNIIEFFYNYFMCGMYKDIIFKGINLNYMSHILLQLCIDNKDLIIQTIKEIGITSKSKKYTVPLINSISKEFKEDLKNCKEFIELPNSMKKEDIKHIAFIIENDEMSLKYEKGNIVIIQLQNSFYNSQDVLVTVEGQIPKLRRIRQEDTSIILQPLNNNYFPQSFSNLELKKGKIKIEGVVVQIIVNNDI